MVNTSTPVTENRSYTQPGDPTENTLHFALERVNTLAEDVDEDVEAIDVRLTTAEADINTVETSVTAEATARANADLVTEFSTVDSAITRDGSNRITGAVEGNRTTSLVTFNGDGTVNTWREVITLSTGVVTRNYTATYSGGYYTGKTFTS